MKKRDQRPVRKGGESLSPSRPNQFSIHPTNSASIRLSGLDGNEHKKDAEMDSGITNTGASKKITSENLL
ncbi:hypothetical protein T03_6379 [Trichinella britovi]|uniref:Uncharacterized protein n=1 Tax=Trichinella britovi TaxID=45882 RepID=A0A0V1C399_TRIBR|nr:hypothetical protein T03_6379 [Trichinella britovi]